MNLSFGGILVHYHEVGLKGRNRTWFEERLRRNIERALAGLGAARVKRLTGRILVSLGEDADVEAMLARLARVAGIANFAPCCSTHDDVEELARSAAAACAARVGPPPEHFAVRTKRSDKTHPLTSEEINRRVGAEVVRATGWKVKLTGPDLVVYVEMMRGQALFAFEKRAGMGGLPVGTSGRLCALLSGGIDSPVAAWRMLRRGAELCYAHFHSAPFTSAASQEKVREVLSALMPCQFRARLYNLPLIDAQRAIVEHCTEKYRVLLYRRMMLRIAERIAYREHAHGLVTGDSISQVASQTLRNMEAVGSAATLPIYRPLAGDDKQEILDLARRIGTYEISCEPFSDCCPMYLPRSPKIHAGVAELDDVEASLPIKDWVEQGVRSAEKETYEWRAGEVCRVRRNDHESSSTRIRLPAAPLPAAG